MEKVWVIEDPDEKQRTKKITRDERQQQDQKSPAAAYSLSLLLWGAGQFYADLIVKGLVFFFLMVLMVAGVVLCVVERASLVDLIRSSGFALSEALLTGEVVLLVVLLFWAYNASDAYHAAARERSRPFTGVKSRVFPALCSLLFPGWGQYLNGQPLKGSMLASLSVIGIFALLSAGGTLVLWSPLEASHSRDIIEGVFAAALFVALPLPFLWLFACYDALKVSSDEYWKEPFLERLKAANNRRRTQGWIRGVFPRLKYISILVLVLALFSAVAYWTFPEGYYLSLLDGLRQYLERQGMTIMPEIIKSILASFPQHP
jgi:TM2 domain-containing membrane protein YozV